MRRKMKIVLQAGNFIQNGKLEGCQQGYEKQQNPKKTFRSALPQILAASAKNVLILGYGMTLGFPTIVIPSLYHHDDNVTDVREKDTLSLTEDQISWFGSINLICVPLGCLVSGTITQPLGRKKSMMLVNIPFIVAWIMFHYSSNVGMLYASLVLTGTGGGLLEAPVLTYVAEITQPHLRGMLSATSSMCVILGIFIQFLMGTMMSWRTVAAVNVTFPLVAMLALCFVPESPYWLIGRGRVADAEKSLCWLRGWVKPDEVQQELSQLVASLTRDKGKGPSVASSPSCSSWRNYTKKTFIKPYLLVSAGFFFGHFTGMITLQTYAVTIFDKLGAPIDKYVATLYLGLVELAGTLVCMLLVHWTGKRPLTIFSTAGNGLCKLAVATYAYLKISSEAWVPMTLLIGSAFLTHVSLRSLPWMLIGEVYPSEVRGVAGGASGSIGYIFGFAANKVYFLMVNSMTLPGTFWFYGGVSLLGTIIFYFFLPETEGRTLHEIEEHFAGTRNLMKENQVSNSASEKWSAVNPAMVPDAESHL
ncbi:facilitated trehalose transporter Tret1-like isoform X1 [Periplaneta americana]|uniref:facilitated trehalose transporter Tret1-like isoform X1 n=2 Tax=Periplaneta americana TaxID=6978 RepID=UPI0037E9304F